jgi:hypothetical protein
VHTLVGLYAFKKNPDCSCFTETPVHWKPRNAKGHAQHLLCHATASQLRD